MAMTRQKYDAKFCVHHKLTDVYMGTTANICCPTIFYGNQKMYSLGGSNSSCRHRTAKDQERKDKDWNLCWSVL